MFPSPPFPQRVLLCVSFTSFNLNSAFFAPFPRKEVAKGGRRRPKKKKSPRKEVSKVASLHILQSFIQQIWPIMKMLKILLKFRQIKLQKPQKSSFSKGFCFRISLIGIQRKFILCEKICFMKCASFEKCNFESCVDDMDHQYFLSMTVSTTTWICENSTPDLCRRPISISSDGSAIISCLS